MQVDEKFLEEHRKMIANSGNLSDFHLAQLKNWPYVVFDNLESVDLKYDFADMMKADVEGSDIKVKMNHPGKVEYDFYFKKNTRIKKDDFAKRLDILEKWIHSIFWTNTKVVFKRNGRNV